jgi:hypothetical protein
LLPLNPVEIPQSFRERHSSDAPKSAELEYLSGTRWRMMVMAFAFNQFERAA